MRFSCVAALALGGGALAASNTSDCLVQNSADLAKFSDCGHHGSLTYCLSSLPSADPQEILKCYANAGCSAVEAASEAKHIQKRCEELARIGELKKRYRAVLEQPEQTTSAGDAHAAAPSQTQLARRSTPLQCLVTSTVPTTECPVVTSNGLLSTLSCFPTQVATSNCGPGLTCSLQANGVTVCMEMHNQLNVGGIIVAIIFGTAIVVGVTFLTFQCCRERSHQKRLEARAEATALARAQTKKQRTQQGRSPLARQGSGAADPFHDRNQS